MLKANDIIIMYIISLTTSMGESTLYEYDGFNRLTDVANGGNKADYEYNTAGIRTSKTVNGERIDFVLDGVNVIAEIKDGDVTNYVRGLTGIIYRKTKDGTKTYYVKNNHGDVTKLVNSSGVVIKSYNYNEFGIESNVDKTDTNPFRYCGEYYDNETGLIYLRARYYDMTIGRFISEDPIMDELNWYSYCNGNPINYWDPTGLTEDDEKEFGEYSEITKYLNALGEKWKETKDASKKASYHKEAELVRGLERSRRSQNIGSELDIIHAVCLIKEYNKKITSVSEALNVPKPMISSIIVSETLRYSWDDSLDGAKMKIRGDASFGLGQIFTSTAQDAENQFYGSVQYSDDNTMKERLIDDSTNIYYIGLVLRACAQYVNTDLNLNYNYSGVNKIYARYNGFGDDAVKYGNETAGYTNSLYDYYS